jgi:4,5-DOPA dioxygenase extradiol
MHQKKLKNIIRSDRDPELMPVLFIGHGSPMNAIEENEFVLQWRELGKTLPLPKAILCISAMQKPPTIHDFGGFPQELYNIRYPAPGSPALAYDIKSSLTSADIGLDERWGLDHGAWSVIRNIYPSAGVPVIEMSLDYRKTPREHYELAKELAFLRTKGVLIVGSGNMVHNLGMISWDHANGPVYGFDWAIHANEVFKALINDNNVIDLIGYKGLGNEVKLAVPTPDHFIPLLYTLALRKENETVTFFNDKPVMGSLTMTSLRIG